MDEPRATAQRMAHEATRRMQESSNDVASAVNQLADRGAQATALSEANRLSEALRLRQVARKLVRAARDAELNVLGHPRPHRTASLLCEITL